MATLTHALSRVAFEDGNVTTARTLADEGHTLARDLGDSQMLAEHLTVLAGLATADGDEKAAAARLEEALALWQRLGSRPTPCRGCTPPSARWRWPTATPKLPAATSTKPPKRGGKAATNPRSVRALNLSGWSALEAGDYDDAGATLGDALVRARVVGDDASLSNVLHSHGELLRRCGRLAEAREELEEALALARSAGWRNQLWWPTWSLAAVAREEGRLDDATELIDQAEALVPRINRSMRLADCKDERALIAHASGDADAAAAYRDEATTLRARRAD